MLTRGALAPAAGIFVALCAPSTASAVDFAPSPGTYTVNTTTMTLTGPGTNIGGSDQGGVAVFTFDNIGIQPGVTINAAGSRPLKFAASGSISVAGVINASGTSASDFIADPTAGGPGGGTGTTGAGAGLGGGGAATSLNNGAGGGGFGGVGARGAQNTAGDPPPAAGGPAYGDLRVSLQAGSAGGGNTAGGGASGGAGGGAVVLSGASVTIASGGEVLANGGGGAVNAGATGGGSGGAIVLHGDTVQVAGALQAKGGDGGLGACCGDGGGGGGGRIAYEYRTSIAITGSFDVAGGMSGARSTSGCCGTAGTDSLDPTGAAGVITTSQAATAETGEATGVQADGATLAGTVDPNGTATSFHFDYGETAGYGSRAPADDADAGSGAPLVVTQAVTGLAPATTYHYRLVTRSAGFTSEGADRTFTTPCVVPKVEGKKLKKAKKAIAKAGCDLGKIKRTFSSKVKEGRVISQKPKPGKALAADREVKLKVSKGEKP
jgi:hypothetical protein